MDKKQFKEFCKKEFQKRGFQKVKNTYYLPGKDLICGIDLQKSNYGNEYYVNYFYFLENYQERVSYPPYQESDIQDRIVVMSKTQTFKGKHFLTAQIEYEEYAEDELRAFFDKDFNEKILPPIYKGKKFILENLERLYFLTFDQDEVIKKLEE